MTRLASWTLGAALAALLSLTLLAPDSHADALPETLGPDEPSHSLSIDYQDGHDLRRARLTIAPLSDDVEPLWRGSLHSILVLTTKGGWICVQGFGISSRRAGHHAEAEAMLPGPEEVAVIFIRPEQGETIGWKIEKGESRYIWVEEDPQILDQTGQRVASEDELVAIVRRLSSPRSMRELKETYESRVSPQSLVLVL